MACATSSIRASRHAAPPNEFGYPCEKTNPLPNQRILSMASTHRIIRPKFTTHADGSDAVLTMHEINGEADGPTVGISAAIHGNEPTGTEIILYLYRAIKDARIKGRLLLLPVANPRAYAVNRRFTP